MSADDTPDRWSAPPSAVRDFLSSHDDEATRYAAVKRHIAIRHPHDRLASIEGKREYVTGSAVRAVRCARAPD